MYELPDTTGEVSASDDQLANQNNAVELKEAEENGKRSFRTTELCSNETDPVACYQFRMYGTTTNTEPQTATTNEVPPIATLSTTSDTSPVSDITKSTNPVDTIVAPKALPGPVITEAIATTKKSAEPEPLKQGLNDRSSANSSGAIPRSPKTQSTVASDSTATDSSKNESPIVSDQDKERERAYLLRQAPAPNPKNVKQESEKKEDISRAKATTVPTEPDSKKIADNFKKDFEKFDTGETKPKSFVEKFISSPYLKMAGIVGVGIIAVEKFLKKDKNKDDDRSPSSDKNATAKSGGANGKTGIAKYAGTYTGKITPKSNGRFGDGTWAYGDKVLMKKEPSIKGFGYALGGDFSLTIGEDGKLSGGLKIWGHDCPFEVGALPAGKNDLQFIIPGAQGYLKFDAQSGKVTGWVAEPGAGNAPMYKRGIISGRRN